MKKLLIATMNPGKLEEIERFLSDLPITLLSLKDAGIADAVEETGKTFEENALLKATYYCQKTGLPTLADDGGAEIDALGGLPGVKTRRWLYKDRDSTDEEIIEYTMRQMEGIPEDKRGMQMRAVLALVLLDGSVFTSTEKVRGVVAQKFSPKRYPGFPFRSILFLPDIGKFYDHDLMTKKEIERFNHRKRALDRLRPILKDL